MTPWCLSSHELNPMELARIAEQTTQLQGPKGETIFHQGDRLTGFYCVVEGRGETCLQFKAGKTRRS